MITSDPLLHTSRLQNEDTSDLDPLLFDKMGRAKIVPATVYESIPWNKLRVWCHKHGIYGLPTTELVEYLKGIIAARPTIEIGTGAGCLGRALGIPLTDNFCQTWPDVMAYYTMTGQPLIQYPPDVENLDALAAVRKYHPMVVVASWVTQISDGSKPGSVYGVDEEKLLSEVETYVMFGSLRNHSHKDICRKPHKIIQEPWMWSKADDSALFLWGI